MTAIISSLASKGFVEVHPSETDRRQKIVKVTHAGKKAYARGEAKANALIKDLLNLIDTDLAKNLLPGLQHLREVLDTQRNERDGLA